MLLSSVPQFLYDRRKAKLLIVDFHTHTFPDKIAAAAVDKLRHMSHTMPFTDGTQGALAASMQAAGIDCSVVLPVATNTHQVAHVNDASVRLNGQGSGMISFGCMHPHLEDWEPELERIARLGLKGIKIHPVYQDTDIDDARFVRILSKCAQLGLIVITHAGLDVGFPGKVNCSPAMIRRALDKAGPVTMVLAHMGGWRNWQEVADLLADTGAYLDTSFSLGAMTANGDGYYTPEELRLLDEEGFVALIRTFGARRVLFGTDSPWGGQAEELRAIRALPLTGEELDAILGQNACRLLGLTQSQEEPT